jgi:hypothetical protein
MNVDSALLSFALSAITGMVALVWRAGQALARIEAKLERVNEMSIFSAEGLRSLREEVRLLEKNLTLLEQAVELRQEAE